MLKKTLFEITTIYHNRLSELESNSMRPHTKPAKGSRKQPKISRRMTTEALIELRTELVIFSGIQKRQSIIKTCNPPPIAVKKRLSCPSIYAQIKTDTAKFVTATYIKITSQ